MKFSLQNMAEAKRATDYLNQLIEAKKTIELKRLSPHRTISQNSYLHVLLAAWGAHFGYSAAEAKEIYKLLNKDIYQYRKNEHHFYKSSADLTADEMSKTIDRFRRFSAANDYPLPLATDQTWIMELQNTIEQTERYL